MYSPALQLDFLRRPRSRWRWLGWGLLAVAVLVAVACYDRYTKDEQRLAIGRAMLDRVKESARTAGPRRSSAVTDSLTLAELRRANAVIEQLTVPWDQLFNALEAADARGLGMLSLTPNARDRTVRLEGESRSMRELLAYVDRLAARPELSRVHLLGYNTVERDGVSATSFTLAADWRQLP